MKNLEIITGETNPILRKKSVEVKKFDSALKKLAKGMKNAMEKANGLGLAAPQVGENIRMCIVTLNYKTDSQIYLTMVNPVITDYGLKNEIDEEGCLSLPGLYGKVARPAQIKVKFCDPDGTAYILELKGMNARVVQHEIDHLDGVLFVDKTTKTAQKADEELSSSSLI